MLRVARAGKIGQEIADRPIAPDQVRMTNCRKGGTGLSI